MQIKPNFQKYLEKAKRNICGQLLKTAKFSQKGQLLNPILYVNAK